MAQNNFIPNEFKISNLIEKYCYDANVLNIIKDDTILENLKSKKFGMLSSGEKRYIEFFIILGLNKEITILDEPFSEIAPIYIEKMISIITRLAPNKSFIISDHSFGSLKQVCSNLYFMQNGELKNIQNQNILRKYEYLP